MTVWPSVVAIGEILWDVFGDNRRLGGAPLNFAAHVRRLGHAVSLISALGDDALGREAAGRLDPLDLDTSLIKTCARLPTGTADVRPGPRGTVEFTIRRPAAYDDISLSAREIEQLQAREPAWLYFGSLLAGTGQGKRSLERLLDALPRATRFLDLNLRPGADSPELAGTLLERANVVKLNEDECERARTFFSLPSGREAFCRAACERYGLRAIAVTLGERGCALLVGGEYAEAPGVSVKVEDSVGAGDAFAAALLHGLCREWRPPEIADFANRLAARVASRAGSLPEAGDPGTENVRGPK